jgi:RNA 3'-terminal phosphate cyclase (ATP)
LIVAEPIRIDGSYGEGGGQILRTSAALSAITGRPIEITNIRAKRTKPGFQPQHLKAVQAAGEICGATLKGAAVGSQYLLMEPQHEVRPGEYRFDIGTAGATTLVVQAILVPLLLTKQPSRIIVTGGTHNDHAPSADYLEQVLLPALAHAGVRSSFRYSRAGFYPRGGGEIELELSTDGLVGIDFASVARAAPTGTVVTSNLPVEVAQRGANVLQPVVSGVVTRDLPSPGVGAAAFTSIRGLAGFTGLGRRGKPMEEVAREAAEPMAEFLAAGADVDEHLADQLVLPLCFSKGPSRYRTWKSSEHLRTVIWVIRQFLDVGLTLEEAEDGTAEIVIR